MVKVLNDDSILLYYRKYNLRRIVNLFMPPSLFSGLGALAMLGLDIQQTLEIISTFVISHNFNISQGKIKVQLLNMKTGMIALYI